MWPSLADFKSTLKLVFLCGILCVFLVDKLGKTVLLLSTGAGFGLQFDIKHHSTSSNYQYRHRQSTSVDTRKQAIFDNRKLGRKRNARSGNHASNGDWAMHADVHRKVFRFLWIIIQGNAFGLNIYVWVRVYVCGLAVAAREYNVLVHNAHVECVRFSEKYYNFRCRQKDQNLKSVSGNGGETCLLRTDNIYVYRVQCTSGGDTNSSQTFVKVQGQTCKQMTVANRFQIQKHALTWTQWIFGRD